MAGESKMEKKISKLCIVICIVTIFLSLVLVLPTFFMPPWFTSLFIALWKKKQSPFFHISHSDFLHGVQFSLVYWLIVKSGWPQYPAFSSLLASWPTTGYHYRSEPVFPLLCTAGSGVTSGLIPDSPGLLILNSKTKYILIILRKEVWWRIQRSWLLKTTK